MTANIREIHSYSHSAEALFKVYTTADWIPKRYEAIGMRNIKVTSFTQTGDIWEVSTTRQVRAQAPRAIKKFAKDWNTINQTEKWTKNGEVYECDLRVDIQGVPVNMDGSMRIVSNETGITNTIELFVSCTIPLLGKKVENFVAGDTKTSIDQEYDWIKSFLDTQV